MRDGLHKTAQLLRHFLAMSAGSYGSLAVAFVISVVLTRRLGVEQFGRLSLLLMVSQVLLLLIVNWTQAGFIRFGAQEFAGSGSVARTFWARLYIVGPLVLVSLAGMVAGGKFLASYLTVPPWALAVVFGHFLFSYVSASVGAVLQAKQAMSRYGLLVFTERAMALALVVLLPASWIMDPVTVLGAYALSALTVSLWGIAMAGRRSFLPLAFDRSAHRDLLRFSLPFTVTSWAGLFATNWLDLVLIKQFLSIPDLGLYALASQIAGVIQQITITFSMLLLPQLSVLVAQGEDRKLSLFLERVLPYWFWGTSVLFCLAVIGARPLVPLVFGPAFEGSVAPLAVLLVASSALALYNAFDPLMNAYGATWALVRICLVSVAVKLGLSIVLIPPMGTTGAAISTVCAYGTSAVLVMRLVQRRTGVAILPIGLLAIPVLVVCLCMFFLRGWIAYAGAAACGLVSLGALVHAFGLFRSRDKEFIRGLWQSLLRSPRTGAIGGLNALAPSHQEGQP